MAYHLAALRDRYPRSRPRLAFLLIVGAATWPLAADAAVGVPHVDTVTAGRIKAELAYTTTTSVVGHYMSHGKSLPVTFSTYSDLRASVFVGGQLLSSQLFPKLGPANTNKGKSVAIKDLEAGKKPSVLFDLYTGGAHCCFKTLIYLLRGASLTGKIEADWGDPGYRLTDLNGDGVPEFVSANDAFAYAFTDYADSSFPIQIWDIQNDKLVDTTGRYTQAVVADANDQLKYYQRAQRINGDVRGILAAYVADEASLGTPKVGWSLVSNALAAGALDRGIGGAKGNAYVAALKRFLTSHGYGS
jgi:hypothetical protein